MKKIETVCHKGANEYAPENTYASAQLCVEWGMDYVEIDVNRSKDGVFYLLHGPEVDATTNGHGRITDLTADVIDQLDAGSWFHPQFANEKVPRLAPFLRWIKGKAKLFLDIKAGTPQEIIDLIYQFDLQDDCFLWCGDDRWALQLRALDRKLQLKINVETVADVIDAHERFQANIVEVALAHVNQPFINACRARGIKIMVYHQEKDIEAFRAVLRSGVDMINLNHGDLFKQIAQAYYAQA
jgi:glycerophosphoryl diester phosphodiesterase